MTIAIDFDGTIAEYNRYRGKGQFGTPLPGAIVALKKLKEEKHTIIINTTRIEILDVMDYLNRWGIPFDYINFNPDNVKQVLHPNKVLADVYIDDRNIEFNGAWTSDLIERINNFKPHWRR